MEVVETAGESFRAIEPLARESPLTALVVLIAALVILTVVLKVVKRWRRTRGEEFAQIVSNVDAVGILMHPNPDPDAMASAIAAKEIAEDRNTTATMYYPGQIRHHENRAFETVLNVEFERIEEVGEIVENDIILVDQNEARGFPGAENIEPLAVIDHHPGGGTGTEFTDSREDYGACATIFTEYFEGMGWEHEDPDDPGSEGDQVLSNETATGLVYGIQADTDNLTKGCSGKDFKAMEYLYEGLDCDKLDRIANPDMDSETLQVKATAITEHEVRSPFAVSDVGVVSNLDSIPQAADELRRLEGINAVVVMGEKDGELHFSGRSKDDRVHMGKVCKKAVEEIPMADAGGHSRMGGGRCLIEYMDGIGEETRMTRDEFKDQLFTEMNGGE